MNRQEALSLFFAEEQDIEARMDGHDSYSMMYLQDQLDQKRITGRMEHGNGEGKRMTLEEARVLLKNLNNQLTSAFYDGDFWVEEGTFEAFEVADAALRGPEPDPETGLVLCGCGGKPRVQHNPRRKMPCRVACPLCFMQADTAKTEDDAKFFWNHGHGYVPGREGTV